MLADDKNLQVVENLVPAINSKAADPALVAALDKVSAVLGSTELVSLNKATDVDRKTPKVAAEDFAKSVSLTAGITKGVGGKIVVGAANFSENQTLAELYRIALTAAGYDATVQTVGNRDLYEPALEKGELQVMPEYTSTFTEFLNRKVNGAAASTMSSGDLTRTSASLAGLGTKVGLSFGKPAGASTGNAFAVTKGFADKYGVQTLSDFAAKCSGKDTVLGGPADCPQLQYCKPGLEKTYGIEFGRFSSLDAGGDKTKNALTSGEISIGLVFSSDSALAAN